MSYYPAPFANKFSKDNPGGFIPPLKKRGAVPIVPFQQIQNEPEEDPDDERQKDMKERNRLAALKCRQKKDAYLAELEKENDRLRLEALKYKTRREAMIVENKVLEEELQFFQSFMSTIMNA